MIEVASDGSVASHRRKRADATRLGDQKKKKKKKIR
jgi:hypothetical protein